MRIFSKRELQAEWEAIGQLGYCADVYDIAWNSLSHLSPPIELSTIEYSEKHRVVRSPKDGSKAKWKRSLTPYLVEPMEALDDDDVREVIMPKPARSGGTVVAENHLLKRLEFGPVTACLWYLAGPKEVAGYADRVWAPLFENHPGVAAKIGHGKSDDNKTSKKVGGQMIELLAISKTTTTNREAPLIVFDETDSYPKAFASSFIDQGRQRGRMVGNARKVYACSHPDLGWTGGISQGWVQSSRGIFVMACAECGDWASPYPTKHWPDVPRYTLHYQKSPERTPVGERIKRAELTAAMGCPNCGALLTDAQRDEMVDGGRYMHAGQTLDVRMGILGDRDKNETMGFWVHVLMVKQVPLSELARDLEAAKEHYERTGRTEKIKSVMIRTFGEAFEGIGGVEGLDASRLKKRAKEMVESETVDVGYKMGEVPDGVKFITAAVDPGGSKFDYMIVGWDLFRRRYVIDRRTIKTRRQGELDINIRPTKVQEDWNVLVSQVIDRKLPLKSDPTRALPVAVTVIDSGDGNATSFAYEFARRMDKKRWGTWRKVRCIKGASSDKAPQLGNVENLAKDDDGKPLDPKVTLTSVGSYSLKEDVLETLGIEDESAGQWFFPSDFPDDAYEEFFNEPLIEGKFTRNGPNESLDLGGYNEAARQILEPDREGRRWDQSMMPAGQRWTEANLPVWAQPISLVVEGGDQAVGAEGDTPQPKKKPNLLQRIEQLNRN